MAGSRDASWLRRYCSVPSQHSPRRPLRSNRSCTTGTNFLCLRYGADPFFMPAALPIIRSPLNRPGFINLCLSCALFPPSSRLFYFLWIPLRSVHSCHSVERISHIPLHTSATLTSRATHRSKIWTTTHHLLPSRQRRPTVHPPVVQSLLDRPQELFDTTYCTLYHYCTRFNT